MLEIDVVKEDAGHGDVGCTTGRRWAISPVGVGVDVCLDIVDVSTGEGSVHIADCLDIAIRVELGDAVDIVAVGIRS